MTGGPDMTGRPTAIEKESPMYRLMKSEKFTLDHLTSGLISFYRQTQVKHFRQFRSALGACEVANNNGRSRYYLLNESGQEFYGGTWID
jgi:hypothetical protein